MTFVFMQHFGFRLRFVLGPQSAKVEGCAATRKVLEEAASPGLWTHPLQAQVGFDRDHFRSSSRVYLKHLLSFCS